MRAAAPSNQPAPPAGPALAIWRRRPFEVLGGGVAGKQGAASMEMRIPFFPDVPVLQRENGVKVLGGKSTEQRVERGLVPRPPGPQFSVGHVHKDAAAFFRVSLPATQGGHQVCKQRQGGGPSGKCRTYGAESENLTEMRSPPKLNNAIFSPWLSELI